MTAEVRPRADEDSAGWWSGLAEHRVVVQVCGGCGRARLPAMPTCPDCGDRRFEAVAVAGTGTVYSRIRVHRALHPDRVDEVPYTVAAVDLDGGGRIFGRVEPDGAIGDRVEPSFVDHDGWTELRFRVVS